MSTKKDGVAFLGIFIFTILNSYFNSGIELGKYAFTGVNYETRYLSLLGNVACFTMIAFLIHTTAEYYFKDYGAIILLRKKTRRNIFSYLSEKLAKKICFVVIYMLVIYTSMQWLFFKTDLSISLLIYMTIIYFIALLTSIIIQFILELKMEGVVGLLSSILIYAFQLIAGDILIKVEVLKYLELLLPANYLNYNRIEPFIQELNFIPLIMIITILMISLLVLKRIIKKIDII